MQRLEGRVAVVTGGGSGIGRGLCRVLAREGAAVAAADVDEPAARRTAELVREAGGRAMAVAADVRDRGAIARLAAVARRELGPVDVLCANAGVFVGGPVLAMTESDWRWLFDVNLMGVVDTCNAFVPAMLERGGGHVLITASVGGFLSGGVTPVYSATKYAVVAYGEALRAECAPFGVVVSLLCPGATDTNLATANRLRPSDWGEGAGDSTLLRPLVEGGSDPLDVAGKAVDGLLRNAEYVFTHPEFRDVVAERFARVLRAFDDSAPR